MKFLKLSQRQPDSIFRKLLMKSRTDASRDVTRSRFAVAVLPDERGRHVQAMRLVPIEVVDQQLIRQSIIDDQVLHSLARQLLHHALVCFISHRFLHVTHFLFRKSTSVAQAGGDLPATIRLRSVRELRSRGGSFRLLQRQCVHPETAKDWTRSRITRIP